MVSASNDSCLLSGMNKPQYSPSSHMPGSTAQGGPYSGSSSPELASASASTPPLSAENPICALVPSCARALLAT
jgi:hypothetical protein